MNFVNGMMAVPKLLMNKSSSIFLASNDYFLSFLDADTWFTRLLRGFLQLLYFACKWLMYMIDVIYFYILQLVGITTDTTIFDSAGSDMTFRLLLDNKEEVTTYIKNFIAMAIVLIIVTAIIALIKMQAQALQNPKAAKKSPTSDVLKSMFKSVLLIIITPLIAILGIVSSSVLLQGLYRATNLSDTNSLAGRIFNASASAANKYRQYADNGVRIPIRYYFSGEDKEDAIYYASHMVGEEKFPSIDYFDANKLYSGDFYDPVFEDEYVEMNEKYGTAAETWCNETYYKYFDRSDTYNENYTYEKHKVMKTHRNEYYAMSDVIGYAMDTMAPYYFVTIQELLQSIPANEKLANGTPIIQMFVDSYKIRLLNSDGNDICGGGTPNYTTIANAINSNSGYAFIEYTSEYASGSYKYVHIKDAVDEMEGAKFTIAYKVERDSTESSGFGEDLYGDYVKSGGSYKPIEKFYIKDSQSRYKTVDLFYVYNADNSKYEKAKTYGETNTTYYYRIGDDYIKIDESNRNKFYYKISDENQYVSYVLGTKFYSATKISYYMPLVSGIKVESDYTFSSEYIKPSNIITARGVFDKASYPTAIRRMNNGNIMFYRDDLVLVSDGSVSNVGKLEEIEAEEEQEEEEEKGFFAKVGSAISSAWNSVKTFVSNLFDPMKLVPDLFLDESRIASTYTNETKSVAELRDGKLHINYFYSDSSTSRMTKGQYGIDINCLFEPLNINWIVLLVGSIVLFKVICTAVFGLIGRALNLFMLILIYPLACATIPLDEVNNATKSGSYAKWSDRYTKLLFSTFGLLLSINFVFVVLPALDKIVFFEAEDLINNSALSRIAFALYNPFRILGFNAATVSINYALIVDYLNKILRIIFQIAAFSLLSSPDGKGGKGTFYGVIQDIVKPGGEGVLEGSPMDAVKKTMKTMATTFNMIFFPHKAIANFVKNSAESTKKVAKDFIPGSAVYDEGKKKLAQIAQVNTQEETRKALIAALQNKESRDEVDKKLEAFNKAHKVK